MPTYFTVKERRYKIVTIESLDWREALEVKRISQMPMGQIPLAVAEQDPAALLAMFVVSMQRVDPSVTEFVLMGENMTDVMGSLETQADPNEEPPPDPPTAPPSENGANGASDPDSTPTPETTGTPAGSPSSA